MSSNYEDIKDEDLYNIIKYKYEKHLESAQKYKAMLDTMESGNMTVHLKGTVVPGLNAGITFSMSTGKQKITFEDMIVSFLNDGQPKTTKMLYDEYSEVGTKVSSKDFSSKLSMRAKNSDRIKNVKIDGDTTTGQRYWWGLKEWFDGDDFKDIYITKIHNYIEGNK